MSKATGFPIAKIAAKLAVGYPSRPLPLYLGKLDDVQHMKIAEQRAKTEMEEIQAK